MADQSASEEQEKPDRNEGETDIGGAGRLSGGGAAGGGFLHVYKPGQGYWTRMFTVGGVAGLLAFILHFIYISLKVQATPAPFSVPMVAGFVGVLSAVAVFFGWFYLNKPGVVDFLIATESEMKKVNWTSKKDLIGSTKVVIIFMFLIAGLLFVIDIMFGWLFFVAKILRHGPFS